MTRAGVDLAGMTDPTVAAMLSAVDPFGLGGMALRARAGPTRDRWLAQWRALLPHDTPWRKLPPGTGDDRLFGGLDLTATLAAGRPIAERGLLAEADGGILVLPMAERLSAAMAARLGAVLDSGTVKPARESMGGSVNAEVGMVAMDEGIDDEALPSALRERLAFLVDLDRFDPEPAMAEGQLTVAEARDLYPQVTVDEAGFTILSETAAALGVASLRIAILAVKAARAAAAFAGRRLVTVDDAAIAARLVLAPRATRLPVAREEPSSDPPEPPPEKQEGNPGPRPDRDGASEEQRSRETGNDIVLAAAKAAIPPGLLQRLQTMTSLRSQQAAPGRAGALRTTAKRGRPTGVRQGSPGGGARLNVIETLRAAAPWQKLRARPDIAGAPARIAIHRDDLRIARFKQRTETVTIFAVDASGSLAANRLAEAKGAVELLLADCYIRRDQVTLLAFRGSGAELVLPPTRSLTRAKRSLADLPGGGATPLASAIDAAVQMAEQIRRRGQTPVVVFLTDGRANVARDGTPGRGRAEEEATTAARAAGATGIRMLVVDASPRPQAQARALAVAMQAVYLPLPRAEAASLSRAVRSVGGS